MTGGNAKTKVTLAAVFMVILAAALAFVGARSAQSDDEHGISPDKSWKPCRPGSVA